jgi:hypothetical protein
VRAAGDGRKREPHQSRTAARREVQLVGQVDRRDPGPLHGAAEDRAHLVQGRRLEGNIDGCPGGRRDEPLLDQLGVVRAGGLVDHDLSSGSQVPAVRHDDVHRPAPVPEAPERGSRPAAERGALTRVQRRAGQDLGRAQLTIGAADDRRYWR